MSTTPPEIHEADAHLQRLARLDMGAAQHIHDCLLDTTEPEEVAKLAHAYTRLTRSLRQNLALHARLKHDREKAARAAEQHERWSRKPIVTDEDLHEAALEERTEELHDAVGRVISEVAAGDRERHTELAHRFDREMDDWVEAPDFLDLDLDDHIAQACCRLGLPEDLAQRWDQLPDPTFTPDPAPRLRAPAEPPEPAEPPAPAAPPSSTDVDDPAASPLPLTDTG